MKKEHYLPTPINPVSGCCGERYFFTKIKHWKLAVILGYSWKSQCATQRGFSFFSMSVARNKTDEWITKKLTELGIKFKECISAGGWSYVVNISQSRKNLALIDELYEKFFIEKSKELFESERLWKHDNFFINDEYRDYVKNQLGCSVDYYTEVTKLEDITENFEKK